MVKVELLGREGKVPVPVFSVLMFACAVTPALSLWFLCRRLLFFFFYLILLNCLLGINFTNITFSSGNGGAGEH
jgi:hypothetical protein